MLENTEQYDAVLESSVISYRDRLQCWAIVRLLPNLQQVIIHRFYRRADADGHLQFLQKQIPASEFMVVFDSQFEH